MVRPAWRPLISLMSAMVVSISTFVVLPPVAARAADPAAARVAAGLEEWFGKVAQLGAVGPLGQPVPSLNLTPSGAAGLGLSTLYGDWKAAKLGGLSSASSLSEFASILDGADHTLGDARAITVAAGPVTEQGGSTEILVNVAVKRTVDAGLGIAGGPAPFSFTSSGGIEATLEGKLRFTLVYDPAPPNGFVGIRNTAEAGPTLDVTIGGKVGNLATSKASLGILGVQLSGGTYNLNASISARLADPNGDGLIAVKESNGTGGERDGELAGDGAVSGLATVTLAGSVSGTVTIVGTSTGAIANLPNTAAVTVTVASSNLGMTPVSVSYPDGSFAPIEAFLTMSPRDLADGLAQLAVTLRAALRAGDTSLPFMRGNLTDAVLPEEALLKFLEQNVTQAPPGTADPAKLIDVGKPRFGSIQELISKLQGTVKVGANEVPVTVSVTDGNYQPDKRKLRLTIGLTRTDGTAQALDVVGPSLTGSGPGVTYSDTELRDTSKNFTDQLVAGHQVTAGASVALIDKVKPGDPHTLVLSAAPFGANPPASLWKGGTPSNDAASAANPKPPYSISGADARTGQVELGDALAGATGVKAANANAPLAQVTPNYQVRLPLVLDLQRARTGNECTPACPYTATNTSGMATIVTSQPLPAQRIMLHTGTALVTADAPISTAVDVTANTGFLQVRVTGGLRMCTKGAPAACPDGGAPPPDTHLLSVGLKSGIGDPDGDIAIPALFDRLRTQPGATVNATVNGQAYANLALSVPGNASFFGGSPTANLTLTMADVRQPQNVQPSVQLSALQAFANFDPNNPQALFGALLAALREVSGRMHGLSGGPLDTKVPLVGRSVGDLLGSTETGGGTGVQYGSNSLTDPSKPFTPEKYVGRRIVIGSQLMVVSAVDAAARKLTFVEAFPSGSQPASGTPYVIGDELTMAVDRLTADPSSTLQDMVGQLNTALGGTGVGFAVDTTTSPPRLKLIVDWQRSYHTDVPLNLSLGDKSMVGTTAQGMLSTTLTGQVKLVLLVPMTPATAADPLANLKVDKGASKLTVRAEIESSPNSAFTANLGPLAVALGNPGANPSGAQLQADVEFGATGSAGEDTLGNFLGGLSIGFTGRPKNCTDMDTSVPLAVCARLPVYYKLGTTWQSASSQPLLVRLPVDGFTSTDGNLSDGKPKLFAPDLSALFSSVALDLGTMGDGLDSYLRYLDLAIKVADAGGTLPVVGEDLQQGKAFLDKMRNALTTVLGPTANGGNLKFSDFNSAESWLENQVEDVLPDGAQVNAQADCKATLAPVTNVHVSVLADPDPKGTTDYEYRVVAFRGDGTGYTLAVTAPEKPKNEASLSSTHKNRVTWTPSPSATGYTILRKVGTAEWRSIVSLPGQTTSSFDDALPAGAGSANLPDLPSEPPKLVNCPADQIQGITVSLDIGQGNVPNPSSCTTPECSVEVPLDLGIPGLSVKAAPGAGKVKGAIGWRMHVKVGLDRDRGFVVYTKDPDEATPEFQLAASLSLPSDIEAQLAFIRVTAKSLNPTSTPLFSGSFSFNLQAPGGGDRIDLSTLKTVENVSSLFQIKLTATSDIKLRLTAKADSALPGVGATFRLKWVWDPLTPGSDAGGNLSELAFQDVEIDSGAFLNKVLGPIFDEINRVYQPIKPIVDTIKAPVPVLSDLSRAAGGGDVSLLTIAQTFSTLAGGPKFDEFVKVFTQVGDVLGKIGTANASCSSCVFVGDVTIKKSEALTTANTPDVASRFLGTQTEKGTGSPLEQIDKKTDADLQNTSGGDTDHPGFTFPALENRSLIFGLLLGQDVPLAEFDSGPLTLGFSFSQSFGPVYAPPPVMVTISGSASVTLRVRAGFDTFGLRTAVEQGKVDAKILNSLYFKTTDASGKPAPVVQFSGELAAGAAVTAVVIEVGIKGGIALTVSFTWNDPNNDGKFRFFEFLTTAMDNALCLFNVDGRLSVFIRVYLTLGVCPFCASFSFTLVDATLLDFSVRPDCTPPPPKLGEVEGETLYLFAGRLGKQEFRGDKAWDNGGTKAEKFVVRQTTASSSGLATVSVTALGISEQFDNVRTVVLDARGYDGRIDALFTPGEQDVPFDRKTVVFGGDNDDTVRTGSGESWVDGNGGADTITAGDRPALSVDRSSAAKAHVAGGSNTPAPGADPPTAGTDTLTVGNADDWVAGDASIGFDPIEVAFDRDGSENRILMPNAGTVRHGDTTAIASDGNDIISVGLGHTDVYAGGGADNVGVLSDSAQVDVVPAADKPKYRSAGVTVVGGPGSDRIGGGSNQDHIYTGGQGDLGPNEPGSGDVGTTNTVDSGTGDDIVHGSDGVDLVTGQSTVDQRAHFYGHGGADILMGAYGRDMLYGGPQDDLLVAEPATVTGEGPATTRTVTRKPNPHTPRHKTLVGGAGGDHIYGGDGGATVFGDRSVGLDTDLEEKLGCGPGTAVASDPDDPPPPSIDDGPDRVFGGTGVEAVNAGGANDEVYAGGGDDRVCGQSGDDTVDAGAGADQAWGGAGVDHVFGRDGEDKLYGNDGGDFLFGGNQTDTVEGNNGADAIYGGDARDILVGGTQLAGRPDTGDRIYGDLGDDLIIGDNGIPDQFGRGTPYDLAITSAAPAEGGKDLIFGGPGPDTGYGGLDGDTVYGNAEADYLEGNNGEDTVYGGDGDDDMLGGSSQIALDGPSGPTVGRPDTGDHLFGESGLDVIAGDNAVISPAASAAAHPITRGRGLPDTRLRQVLLYDLGHAPVAGTSGGDEIAGADGVDLIFGQGGTDVIDAGAQDDYAEGGQDRDIIGGGDGQDDLVGGGWFPVSGSGQTTVGQLDAGDVITGGRGADVAIGDNGAVLREGTPSQLVLGRVATPRSITPYDLAAVTLPSTHGADIIAAGEGDDVALGQAGNDRVKGEDGGDYVEGGADADWVEGGSGDDELTGGGSTVDGADTGDTTRGQPDGGDVVYGGDGDDAVLGDNGLIARVAPYDHRTLRVNPLNVVTQRRTLRPYDLQQSANDLLTPATGRSGDDQISGGSGVDVVLGQDGPDAISGGGHDDYVEGNGGADRMWGDRRLAEGGVALPPLVWPGTPSPVAVLEGDLGAPDGQDDLLGGSTIAGFRDGGDKVEGDGAADYAIGDNGTAARDVRDFAGQPVPAGTETGAGLVRDRVYTMRYPTPAPDGAAYVRVAGPGQQATRFCATRPQGTCEQPDAYGDDTVRGGPGDDTLYGQDGNDLLYGGDQDDDMYGELGHDQMWGDAGEDAMVGDRGGVVDLREDGSRTFTVSYNQVPQITYTGFTTGSVSRQTDLRHDVNGDVFVGTATSAPMPYDGEAFGGNDRMRGGAGHDSMHAAVGDDLANGDSGGDSVFGDDGADVLWGGKGSDDPANPNDRGAGDSLVDYVFGGKGATSGPSVDPQTGSLGADVLDFRPRGSYPNGCVATPWPGEDLTGTVVDPCAWFEMTGLDDADPANNQHHTGIDWIYGGWDRDVLQGDVTDNGPNPGDRLLDWGGAYNIYTHCNAAYGGYNDVRQHSPDMQAFLLKWAGALGAGQAPVDVTVPGTAAFGELALVYQSDLRDHGSGPAFPKTPGHFDQESCAP
ncbi:Ca2+-binding RTX toxin-like protein [Micromonospora kangleipakensis]|uniref:Ca2+-binding RTX toxin-like protein n=1 Tax=Micromonospora kangleipakensis TaxID=1077942 RepID=A0A4Q8BDV6_9ACTN|nr:calcium-binding protein [Micromonospora kangleipakensis]RZU76087.1 Ca2+-binding RTX toxin-like protein [Micromonospora kangleipakensis]